MHNAVQPDGPNFTSTPETQILLLAAVIGVQPHNFSVHPGVTGALKPRLVFQQALFSKGNNGVAKDAARVTTEDGER
jgi:hypothetical protein